MRAPLILLLLSILGPVHDKVAPAPEGYLGTRSCRAPRPFDAPAPLMLADLVVTANISYQYVINGSINPVLTLTRGETYSIDLTGLTDEHPFTINTDPVFPFAPYLLQPAYGQVVDFTPDSGMPDIIHYHCTVHYGQMTGTILLVDPPCPADISDDGVVNTTDFGLFVNAFGQSCSGCGPDINNDGVVNTTDFGLFVNAFGTSC